MNNRLKAVMLTIAVAFSTPAGSAEPTEKFTANDLLTICAGEQASSEKCSLFIAGLRSGMQAQREFIGFNLAKRGADLPPEGQAKLLLALTLNEPLCSDAVTNKQLSDAFVTRMESLRREHPDADQTNAGHVVLMAWRSAHCGKVSSGTSEP